MKSPDGLGTWSMILLSRLVENGKGLNVQVICVSYTLSFMGTRHEHKVMT